MISVISRKIKSLLKNKNQVHLLSAGSGIDLISFKLKKKFKNQVDIDILDISKECIDLNKKLFRKVKLNYKIKDIFSPFNETYDIIYNTGLLEHFEFQAKKEIIENIKSHLLRGGHYITLNPSTKGIIYKKAMKQAIKKGIWPFGPEKPIKTLNHFSDNNFKLIHESYLCSVFQFKLLIFFNKSLFLLLLPFILLLNHLPIKYTDRVFGKKIGYYGILSIFKNKF